MRYKDICSGSFISRPNRFIAYVEINGRREKCHVKNTGRCRELLVPGVTVYLEKSDKTDRKTQYDLIAVEKNGAVVNMDSQLPNAVAFEWVSKGGLGFIPVSVKREVTYGDSRFDLYCMRGDGRECLIEVKGVTLEYEGVARFPDAPTERGIKHVKGLAKCVKDGYDTYILFVIQMTGIRYFMPNYETQPEFGKALIMARDEGVNILAVDCMVTSDSMKINDFIEVRLEE